MSNIYLEYMEELFKAGAPFQDLTYAEIVNLALVKELQTLNKTLKKVTYEDEWGCPFLRVGVDPPDKD